MINVMSHPLSAKPQAATRHLPVARGRERGGRDASSEARLRAARSARSSEPRLQAAVVRPDKGSDPYADVPCTD
ncbi:MAG: hypothetical protein BGO98_28430 [Myxococcales bacterium 68-20]|nr:MAG: hypothetical protein BGO98_28430 [Myxococcales bacterium 68-20]